MVSGYESCILDLGEILSAEAEARWTRMENMGTHMLMQRSDYLFAPGNGQKSEEEKFNWKAIENMYYLPLWVLFFSRDQWLPETPSNLM